MRISYRWLARHVDLDGLSPADVARDLTIHTAEVEGLERFAPVLGDVVVGRVVERAKHPGADKLSLCRVDLGPAGSGELLQIVCGAANVAEGQKVAVARVGTTLPGGVRIQKAKIRGESSSGMICSERELGLGEEHAGIWVLPEDAQVGLPVDRALGAEDWVLEIDNKSLTHRPDCWGHRGIAAEIAAIRRRALRPLDVAPLDAAAGEPYPVRVETKGCPRYLGLPVDLPAPDGREGGRGRATPTWMRLLLLAAGQRPIDLLVDVSNFVMLDLGQPNHLFDRRRLSREGIVVRDARPGERMTTLDGVERRLEPGDVLVCSGDEPVALAGVMGGEESKVAPDTRELLLEVATFHPATIRRTAMRLGLRTEASARFEKNLDPTLPPRAAAHLVRLLGEIVPGVGIPRPAGDAGTWTDPARRVALRPARMRALLGAEIADDEIADALERLGLGVERGDGRWEVAIPSARATRDLAIEEDLVEEVGRLRGYDTLPARPVVLEAVPTPRDPRRALVRRVQDRLAGAARFRETLSYSFLPDDLARTLGVADEPYVEVENPVLQELGRVRRSVAPSLLALLEPNLRRRAEVRLFEVGKGARPEDAPAGEAPREAHEAALAWAAPRPQPRARFDAGVLPRLRGVVEDVLAAVGRPAARWARAADAVAAGAEAPPWAHPARTLAALAGPEGAERAVAVVGALDPAVARALGERVAAADAAFAVLSLDRLLEIPEAPPRFRPLPRFPALEVDVALALPADLSAGEARAAIVASGKGLVAGLELFDLYEGESLGPGRKSLAWHVVLQAPDRTLTDEDQARFLDRLARAATELGGELRRE